MADEPWTRITWAEADATMSSLSSVVRLAGGFLALGLPVSTLAGFRTPLLHTADGRTWTSLNQTAVGADSVVIGVHQLAGAVSALTVAGGAVPCDEPQTLCLELRPPLRAWTSPDGLTWTLQAEPINLVPAPGETFLAGRPLAAAQAGRTLVVEAGLPDFRVATTQDGRAWELVTPIGLPAHFRAAGLGAAGSGFVLAGSIPSDERTIGLVAWSADGRNWEGASLPSEVGGAGVFAAASGGMIVATSTDVAPGWPAWWSSLDGRSWESVTDYAPLGRWRGAGQGTGVVPNGDLAGDGERLVAYDTVTGSRAWTSFDGRTWTDLAIGGSAPPAAGHPTQSLTVMPIGLLFRDNSGNAWFGQPDSD